MICVLSLLSGSIGPLCILQYIGTFAYFQMNVNLASIYDNLVDVCVKKFLHSLPMKSNGSAAERLFASC